MGRLRYLLNKTEKVSLEHAGPHGGQPLKQPELNRKNTDLENIEHN